MGQRGVHATINKDENTGRFVVHLTTVQWSLQLPTQPTTTHTRMNHAPS